jgi:hypothetical protein
MSVMLEMFLIAAFGAMAEREGAGMLGGCCYGFLLEDRDAVVSKSSRYCCVSSFEATKAVRRWIFQQPAFNKDSLEVIDKDKAAD